MSREETIMKKILASTHTLDAPVELSEAQLDQVTGGAITAVQINGGGNTPNGNANGVPEVNVNPAGFAPPGQN
jgi:hypothetical protein